MDVFINIDASKYSAKLTEEQKSFADLTLLQKYDAVLNVLYSESGKAPTFDDINAAIVKEKKKVHWGEVMDILYTLIGDGYLYGHFTNQQQQQIFLLSFNGKFLKETGGLEKKLEKEKSDDNLKSEQLAKSVEVSKWTKWNIALALLMTATTLSVLIFTCTRDTTRFRKESKKQLIDKQLQSQTRKCDSISIQKPLKVSPSLKDTVKEKEKIEK
jgi:hypothetical protein